MKKLLETEESFLIEMEKVVDSLKEGIKAIDSDKDLDDKTKDFLKEETVSLAMNIKDTFKNYRRYYTELRKSIMFDPLEKNSE